MLEEINKIIKEKDTLILCCGYPYSTDMGFGYHVAKALENVKLPDNVDFLEIGFHSVMIPAFVEGKEKLIVVDVYRTKDAPGTVVRLKREEVPVTVDGVTDVPKHQLMGMLNQISVSGKCPETIFIGVVPKDTKTSSEELTPEIKSKINEVIGLILKEVQSK